MFVAAYVRRCEVAGAFAAVSRRGDASAGAVFVEIVHAGGADLWAPRSRRDGARGFEQVLAGVAERDVAERIGREARFDADLWVVTVEDRAGRDFFMADERG